MSWDGTRKKEGRGGEGKEAYRTEVLKERALDVDGGKGTIGKRLKPFRDGGKYTVLDQRFREGFSEGPNLLVSDRCL